MQAQRPETQLISRKQFADQIGFTTKTVDAWIKAGRIKTVRFGSRAVRIPADEADRIVREGVPAVS